MDRYKLQSYINIAKKAGYVIIGGDKLYNYKKKLYLIIYEEDAGNNTLKIIERLKTKDVPIVSIENLSTLMNMTNCKLIAIKNKNLSDIIYNIIKE